MVELRRLVEKRHETVKRLLGRSSAVSVSDALSTLIRLLWHGSESAEEIYSLGVASQGWYGVPEGLVFSFPVKFQPAGRFRVLTDMILTEDVKMKLPEIVEELQCEIETIYPNPSRVRWRRESRAKQAANRTSKKKKHTNADDEQNSKLESNGEDANEQ